MLPITSKEFKKRYAPSTKNAKNQGVWSGRGIGIPSLGALDGSGDGSKYLGRPRRPPSRDQYGSPSQSADSGMASYMARVNKGYEEYESLPMFPEQELEDEYIYSWEDVDPIINRKLPRSFRVAARHRIRESDIFGEDFFVENSRYSLMSLNEISIAEEEIPDLDDLESSRIVSDTFDFLADLTLDLSDMATADISSFIAFVPSLGTNLLQLWLSLREGKNILYEATTRPTHELIKEADDISKDLRRDLVDLLQALIRLIPAPGWDDLISISLSIGEKVGMKLMGGAIGFSAAKLYSDVYSKLPEAGKFIIEWNPSTGGPLIGGILIRSIEMLGNLRSAIDQYTDYVETATAEEEFLASLQISEEDMTDIFNIDSEEMQLQELKDFIMQEIAFYGEPRPNGYTYREVPVVVYGDEDSFEILDDPDDLSVLYRTDGGVVGYQYRNRIEEERALRSIIRNDLRDILFERKKKR
jgi:hypothetical protein